MSGLRIFLFHLLFVSLLITSVFVLAESIGGKGRTMDSTNDNTVPIMINADIAEIPAGMKTLTYQQIRDIAYPDSEFPKYPTCTYRYKDGLSGILKPNQVIFVAEGMVINIVDTSGA